MTNVQRSWILSTGPRCEHEWAKGQCVIAIDGFEFEPMPVDIWDDFKHDAEFSELRRYADDNGATVSATMLFEGSVIADDKGYRFKDKDIETVAVGEHSRL